MDKKISSLAFSRGANQGFHVVQILLQRLPARTGEAVFGFRQAPGERFRAGNIAGVLKLARMNADQGTSIANLIDAAQQNASSLANVADTVGTNLDVTA